MKLFIFTLGVLKVERIELGGESNEQLKCYILQIFLFKGTSSHQLTVGIMLLTCGVTPEPIALRSAETVL